MTGRRRKDGKVVKPKACDMQPIHSETFHSRRRQEAPTAKERAAVEFNALRARMKNATDQEWDQLATLLAGRHRGR